MQIMSLVLYKDDVVIILLNNNDNSNNNNNNSNDEDGVDRTCSVSYVILGRCLAKQQASTFI